MAQNQSDFPQPGQELATTTPQAPIDQDGDITAAPTDHAETLNSIQHPPQPARRNTPPLDEYDRLIWCGLYRGDLDPRIYLAVYCELPQSSFAMPPPAPRKTIPKDRFAQVFGAYKTQTYHDPASRGPGTHTIRSLAWNPTGGLIATGSADRTLRIWNPDRPHFKYSTELRGHTAGIEKVLFNPIKESELASCSSDGTVRIWDVRSKNCVSRIDVGGEAFTLSWSADGSVLVAGRKDDVLIPISVESASTPVIIQPADGTAPAPTPTAPATTTFKALTPQPQSVQTNGTAFAHNTDPDGLTLFVTTGEGTVKIIDYSSFSTLHTLHAHTSSCLSVSLSPTARYLATGGSDALISLWDTTDWICKRTVSSTNGGAVRGVSWSFDGRFVVGACDEPGCGGSGLEIFHAETGESVFTIPTPGGGGAANGMGPSVGGLPAMSSISVPAVEWHPSRYWLAYSVTAEGIGSTTAGLRIVGAAGEK
ncbi:hypothetical protein AJ80_00881 [Polytolypa hystricis UAMH7299]|uniref:Uncharacterized protein n=1 Tax=Polytolypa hystricis (strain UAMH7299) TaxID=1447883 RepID=A0A2B7Z2F8_POLH7|nr:hypothetical protein AJ80_00881 [Polytolypa hystricis UAMH7299]